MTLDADRMRHAQVLDYDRDGRSDLMFPDSTNNAWVALRSTAPAGGFAAQGINTGMPVVAGDRALIVDDRGDGLPDLIYPSGSNYAVRYSRSPATAGVIDRITEISVDATFTDLVERTGEFFKGSVESARNTSLTDENGVRYVMKVTLTNVEDGGDILIMKSRGLRLEEGEYAWVRAVGSTHMRVHMDRVATYLLDPFAPAHEFGHMLGFYHAANGNGDIMSYDSTPTVKLRHLQQLYDRNKSFVSKYFGW